MSLQIDVVTLFPTFFDSPLKESILKRAQKNKKVRINLNDLRDYTHDRHKTADDKPFGGGAGMVMKPEPIFECVEAIQKKKKARSKPWVIMMGPHGKRLDQKIAAKLSKKKHIVIIAGHYEGIDYRVNEHLVDQEISMGDFITMGGEAPALCLIEAVTRLLPGVLGNKESIMHESFQIDRLEHAQYTKPREYRGLKVPEVLLSGNHREVQKWRDQSSLELTKKNRPDLLKNKRRIFD